MREYKRLFHLSLHVNDLQKSIEFYKKLGCDYVFTLKLKDGRDWLTYMRVTEGQYLELFQIYADHPLLPRGPVENKPDDFFAHLAFLVPDIYYTACEWAKEGVQVVFAPFKPEPFPLDNDKAIRARVGADRNYIAWVQDPDGNWIEVMEELEDSWQKVFEEKHPF